MTFPIWLARVAAAVTRVFAGRRLRRTADRMIHRTTGLVPIDGGIAQANGRLA